MRFITVICFCFYYLQYIYKLLHIYVCVYIKFLKVLFMFILSFYICVYVCICVFVSNTVIKVLFMFFKLKDNISFFRFTIRLSMFCICCYCVNDNTEISLIHKYLNTYETYIQYYI